MRGNETHVWQEVIAAYKFPIPMRGNERRVWCHFLGTPARFPIPMRGNESFSRAASASVGTVPDPHEG